MKPLLSRPITRECINLGEWESAVDQLTDAGRDAFKARQKARMEAARKEQEAAANVRPIIRKVAK